jgi:hypothetical protein
LHADIGKGMRPKEDDLNNLEGALWFDLVVDAIKK